MFRINMKQRKQEVTPGRGECLRRLEERGLLKSQQNVSRCFGGGGILTGMLWETEDELEQLNELP